MRYVLLVLLIASSILLGHLSSQILEVDELVLGSLADQLAKEQIEVFIEKKERLSTFGHIFVAFFILFKVTFVTLLLDLGCFLYNVKIKFEKLFDIVVKAEFVFLLAIILKTAWFYYSLSGFTLEDYQNNQPLSLLNFIDYETLDPWYIYPLQVLNIFEIAYWFLLAYLIGREINHTINTKGLQIVASSYGVGLLILVGTIMFLTLNMS